MAAKRTTIGERRHRITIQEPTESRTSTYGEETLAWSDVTTCWAKVISLNTRSGEDIIGDQPMVSTAIAFDISYRSTLNEKMRVVFNGDNYDILYIQQPDFKQSTVIQAVRVQ